jgi:hypothetical protein
MKNNARQETRKYNYQTYQPWHEKKTVRKYKEYYFIADYATLMDQV